MFQWRDRTWTVERVQKSLRKEQTTDVHQAFLSLYTQISYKRPTNSIQMHQLRATLRALHLVINLTQRTGFTLISLLKLNPRGGQ